MRRCRVLRGGCALHPVGGAVSRGMRASMCARVPTVVSRNRSGAPKPLRACLTETPGMGARAAYMRPDPRAPYSQCCGPRLHICSSIALPRFLARAWEPGLLACDLTPGFLIRNAVAPDSIFAVPRPFPAFCAGGAGQGARAANAGHQHRHWRKPALRTARIPRGGQNADEWGEKPTAGGRCLLRRSQPQ
jgi:hypothetical protein